MNRHIRHVCDRFAAEGYAVVAPALFDRVGPGIELGYEAADVAQGRELRGKIEDGLTLLEARPEAVADWVAYSHATARGLLSTGVRSWMTGVNTNIAGREEPTFFLYRGTTQAYREWAEKIAASGYEPFIRSS